MYPAAILVAKGRTKERGARAFARVAIPWSAILLPVAFFLSVLSPQATEPNALIYLAYIGGVLLAAGVLTLGIGLLRGPAAAPSDRR